MIITLSRRERMVTERCLGVDPDAVDGAEAVAIMVAESPAPKVFGMPLFPYPPGSVGGRLLEMSGLSALEYLRRFARVTLLDSHPPDGMNRQAHRAAAGARATELLAEPGATFVLLGRHVADAFGLAGAPTHHWLHRCADRAWHDGGGDAPTFWQGRACSCGRGSYAVRLPSLGGRNHVYGAKVERDRARAVMQAAATAPLPPCPRCSVSVLAHAVPIQTECPCGAVIGYRRELDGAVTAYEVA